MYQTWFTNEVWDIGEELCSVLLLRDMLGDPHWFAPHCVCILKIKEKTQTTLLIPKNISDGWSVFVLQNILRHSTLFLIFSTFLYLKFLVVWALVLLADFVLEFRFEYLWPFWLFIRSVYDSFRYQGLVSSYDLIFLFILLKVERTKLSGWSNVSKDTPIICENL